MPRPPRCVIPHWPHHVRQRGVRKDPVFHDDSDRLVYLRTLSEACNEHGVAIWAYCLMTNHVHLIAVPDAETSLSQCLHDAHTDYSTYFNRKYGYVGHVWQGRPNMCAMDESHLWNAVRYVERNPVRAGMVAVAQDYPWSSAPAHCHLKDGLLLSSDFPPPGTIDDWAQWLRTEHCEEEQRAIRKYTSTGRPWVKPELLAQLEALTGRTLAFRAPGRPRRGKSGG